MGQRLNIEIVAGKEGDKRVVLANAYYHWSGYTDSAIQLIQTIIDAYRWSNRRADSNFKTRLALIEEAVRVLEATGAGVNKDEEKRIAADNFLSVLKYKKCRNRNEGLLSVTEDGIRETQIWADENAIINIDTKKIIFLVFFQDDTLHAHSTLPQNPGGLCMLSNWVSFDDFESKIVDMYTKFPNGFCDGQTVIRWIS